MQSDLQTIDIAHVIQLAVAPVFLLSGVAGTLTVLTNRMARIIDRARVLEERLVALSLGQSGVTAEAELAFLSRRARLIQRAITLSTCCALLICAVIVILFLRALLAVNLANVVALLFIAAMLTFIGALGSFLREILLATSTLRFGVHHHGGKAGPPG